MSQEAREPTVVRMGRVLEGLAATDEEACTGHGSVGLLGAKQVGQGQSTPKDRMWATDIGAAVGIARTEKGCRRVMYGHCMCKEVMP